MEQAWAIDKDYVFYAVGAGLCDDVLLHVQCSHEEAMDYGKCFLENNTEEDEEIDVSFKIKDQLDEALATGFAQSLFQEWESDHEEESEEDEEPKDKTVEDFYDEGWETVSCLYYYYTWSPEFIKDCKEYFLKNTPRT
jgi:hypothetical protein